MKVGAALKDKEYKTPEYTRRAIDKYKSKFDRCAVQLPKGTAEIIRDRIGQSVNAYINSLVSYDLEKRGLLDMSEKTDTTPEPEPTPNPWANIE